MSVRPVLTAVAICLALAGCNPTAPETEAPGIDLGDISTDAQGRCFARAAAPTSTSIVTELVEVLPEVRDANNVVTREAVFRNVTRPRTLRAGQGERFETVCPQIYTTAFVASLQRALIVRQAYTGQVNGLYDAVTASAVQRFQRPRGFDSPLLSATVARDLGVLALGRDPR
ncbi:MAG: peptidoglycan-binding protein [Loktanella sp.]|nr:peptidoglycan-binding protein [Loktanella sp.]